MLLSGRARHELYRHGPGAGADDAAHDPGPVPVVPGVVGGVDGGVHARGGFGEGHVPLQTAGPDATGTAGLRAAEPRVVLTVGGADVEVVAGHDDPHRHVRAQRAVASQRRELQLLRGSDLTELVTRPRTHRPPSLVMRRGRYALRLLFRERCLTAGP